MAYHFEFDSKNRILRGNFTGRVTDEELTSFYRMARSYVDRTDPQAALTDFSEVSSLEVAAATVRKLAKSEPALPQTTRPRVIVAPSNHIFGMARMFEFEGETTRPNLHVVRTLDEAWAIFGVQQPKFGPVPEVVQPLPASALP